MTLNKPTKQNFLWKGIRTVTKIVTNTYVDMICVMADSNQGIARKFSKKKTSEQVKKFIDKHARSRGDIPRGILGFNDTSSILKRTEVDSERSCQRGIIELCALTMTCKDRRRLLKSMGFPYSDVLFWILRRQNQYPNDHLLSSIDHVMKQRWYKEVEEGKTNTVDTLYRIISSNPNAFCQMVVM